MTCDTSDKTLVEAYTYFVQEIQPKVAPLENELNLKVLKVPYLDELADENAKPRRKAKKAAVKSKPKFANPDDKKATWTGKGRQPNWYRAAIEKGMSPEELAI